MESADLDNFQAEVNLINTDEIKRIYHFIQEKEIENVILIDRAARGLAYALTLIYRNKNISRPHFYFINPLGVASNKNCKLILQKRGKELVYQKDEEKLKQEFISKYARLYKFKDNAVMLYDVCFHSGINFFSTLEFLQQIGFKRIIKAVSFYESPLCTQFDYIGKSKTCYPFGVSSHICKTVTQLCSYPNPKGKKDAYYQYAIIKEALKRKGLA